MAELNVNQTSDGFGAAMDDATMERIEKAAHAQGTGQQRRCALVAMARDSATLLSLAKESPEAFDEFANMILDFHAFAKAQMEIAEAAFARIAVVHDLSKAA